MAGSVLDYEPTGFRRIWGLIASPPCFPAGTPVVTARGILSIEEVDEGDFVLTHRGRWREVTATMSRMAKTVRFGHVQSTADHPFLARPQVRTWNNDQRKSEWHLGPADWIPADKTQEQFLARPVAISPADQSCLPEGLSWWLVGRWLADGWANPDRGEICLGVGAHKAAAVVEQLDGQWRRYAMPTSVRFTRHASADQARWLHQHFGFSAAGKTVPGWTLGMHETDRRALLEGYLSGDGTITSSGWRANSVSVNLATGVMLLASSLGYTTGMTEIPRPRKTTIEGRVVRQRGYWSVAINHDDGRYTRVEHGLRWIKQRKDVEVAATERVYDITVEEDHSFIAWGYVVHNCQSFSSAGKGAGRREMEYIFDAVNAIAEDQPYAHLIHGCDERTQLVLAPLVWALAAEPEWIALEQVPPVLPVWEMFAVVLRERGYHVACGILSAEEFGVPQTRKRAILVAHRRRGVSLPAPTHRRYKKGVPQQEGDPDLLPWVSMAEALGWANGKVGFPRLADTYSNQCGADDVVTINGTRYRGRDLRDVREPAFALTEKARSWTRNAEDAVLRNNTSVNAALRTGTEPAPTMYFGDRLNKMQWELHGSTMPNATVRQITEPAHTIAFGKDAASCKWHPVRSGPTRIARRRPKHWTEQRPATAVACDARVWPPGHKVNGADRARLGEAAANERYGDRAGTNAIRIEVAEAAVLQSFPADYPWQGSKTRQFTQVGNAVPPLLAGHVLSQVAAAK